MFNCLKKFFKPKLDTVPQKVEKNRTDLTIRFRVNDNYRNSYIVVKSNGVEIKRIKKAVLAPGEMESVKIMGPVEADLKVEIENGNN